MMIDQFRGEYAYLSNFWACPIMFDGSSYPSVEHAYQAAKTAYADERRPFQSGPSAITAVQAKRLGRQLDLRGDWWAIHAYVMEELLIQKFSLWLELRGKLLETGNSSLVESNYWHDVYWGVCVSKWDETHVCRQQPHEPKGLNKLGILLMRIREKLRKEDARTRVEATSDRIDYEDEESACNDAPSVSTVSQRAIAFEEAEDEDGDE